MFGHHTLVPGINHDLGRFANEPLVDVRRDDAIHTFNDIPEPFITVERCPSIYPAP